jgi:hypothetical protein
MSESSIAEMIVPGTFIEVRAEGLIAVGAIATGNIGIVGTAARGPVDKVVPLGSFGEATDIFGLPDPFRTPRQADAPLALTRALDQAYTGGARNVFAVRIANGKPVAATLRVRAAGDTDGFDLTARGIPGEDGLEIADSAGTWGREITVEVTPNTQFTPPRWRVVIAHGTRREVYEGANVGEIHGKLGPSRLVQAGTVSNAASAFAPLEPTHLAGGTDGANVGPADIDRGLRQLESQPVNILLTAGLGANIVGTMVLGHLDRTEAEGRERIAVLGAKTSGNALAATDVETDAQQNSDDRIVLVAPGLLAAPDPDTTADVVLPPSFLAAAVGGKLSTLAPHISLTNKVLAVRPDVRYATALNQNLLTKRVLLVRTKFGAQVVKGITTSPPPFESISIRRIVDYAKAGVRLGADPYIGRLNNARVRAALKSTLDGFLSQMVLDEMLISYQLDVSATRDQERRGICAVVMTLRPTFSIDFIRVTMNLE